MAQSLRGYAHLPQLVLRSKSYHGRSYIWDNGGGRREAAASVVSKTAASVIRIISTSLILHLTVTIMLP